MTVKQVERRIDDYCSLGEKILLRVLLFGCFMYEAVKFAWALLQ
jgi:hypothetical protein